jgi:DNA-directed RNA polymerase III subunit RPC1
LNRILHASGFSIGISDVTPSDVLRKLKHDILMEGFKKADASIALYEKGDLELRPGCVAIVGGNSQRVARSIARVCWSGGHESIAVVQCTSNHGR